MTPLEHELVDLAPYLAHGEGADLAAAVRRRLEGDGAQPRLVRRSSPGPLRRRPALVLAAAVAVAALVVAVAPARRAVARLFRIGAVEIRPTGPASSATPTPPTASTPPTAAPTASTPTASTPTASTAGTAPASSPSAATVATAANVTGTTAATGPPGRATTLDEARRAATFVLRLADAAAGPVRSVLVDDTVPGGLVAVGYDRFTLVQVASAPNAYPVMAKLAPPGVTVEFTAVGNRDAVWVRGAHEIAYLAPDGSLRADSVRRAGSTLVWTIDDVTLRVEGIDDRDAAIAIAASVS